MATNPVPVGFQALIPWPDLPKGWADIDTSIASAAHGTGAGAGAGSALFTAALAVAKSKVFTTINATIRADNALGLCYCTHIGFQDYATDPDHALKVGRKVGRISRR